MRLEIVTVESTYPERYEPLKNYSVTGDNGYTYNGYADLWSVKPGDRFAVVYNKNDKPTKFEVIRDPVQNKTPEEDLELALKAYFAEYDHEVCFGQELYDISTSELDSSLLDMMLQEPYLTLILDELSTGDYGVVVVPIDDSDSDEDDEDEQEDDEDEDESPVFNSDIIALADRLIELIHARLKLAKSELARS